MYTMILNAHSGIRWLLALGLLVALVRMLMLWTRGREFRKGDGIFLRVTGGVFDLQALLGIVLFILAWTSTGILLRHQAEHALTMILAIVAYHVGVRPGRKGSARTAFLAILLAAVLVAVGVLRLPQGW